MPSSALGFYAARTERMLLGSGVFQSGPAALCSIAQTAITLSNMSGGRFLLGLGASGPQVIEGLHGVPFVSPADADARDRRDRPSRDRRQRQGPNTQARYFQILLPGRREQSRCGCPLAAEHNDPDLPGDTVTQGGWELTGEVADGWLGTSFVPEGAPDAYFKHLDRRSDLYLGGDRDDLDICQGAEVSFARDDDELGPAGRRSQNPSWRSVLVEWVRRTRISTTGAYSRQGWSEVACNGSRPVAKAVTASGAVAAVTDDMVLATTLIGTEPMIRQRLRVWATGRCRHRSLLSGRRDDRPEDCHAGAGRRNRARVEPRSRTAGCCRRLRIPGYFDQSAEIWSKGGEPLATTHQLVYFRN